MRAMTSPSCGDEVRIASGIESASPAAMKDAIGIAAGCVVARMTSEVTPSNVCGQKLRIATESGTE